MDAILDGLRAHLPRLTGEKGLELEGVVPIPEGHSGFTYFVDGSVDGSPRRWVMRVPPPGARIAGPADVLRQGRIMAALHGAGLPVPAVPVICEDGAILGDGRPFILMEAVAGERIEPTLERQAPAAIARSAVEVLKRLHALPVAQTGIGAEEAVTLEAEMMRWAWLMSRAPEELTGQAAELGGALAAARPAERQPSLVHGDYHYGNMLFRGSEVVAVLDWEIAQIGQPLLDLGCLAVVAQRQGFEGAPRPGGGVDVSPQDLFGMYGVTADEMRWYLALSSYKYAAIFGYNLMLHRRGKRPDPMYEGLTETIVGLVRQGLELLK